LGGPNTVDSVDYKLGDSECQLTGQQIRYGPDAQAEGEVHTERAAKHKADVAGSPATGDSLAELNQRKGSQPEQGEDQPTAPERPKQVRET